MASEVDPANREDPKCWLVLASVFFGFLLADGIIYTSGIFYAEFLVFFGKDSSMTSWIAAFQIAAYFTIGPVASALIARFQCRRVVIFGSVITSVALFTCSYASHIAIVIVLFGIMAGIGVGFLYVSCFVAIGEHFSLHRSLAMGIATSGSGVGMFVLAPLCEALIQSYSWRGAFWILSALTLNGCVAGATFTVGKFQDKTHGGSLWSAKLVKSRSFWLCWSATAAVLFGVFIVVTFLPDYAAYRGLESNQAAILLSILGASNTVCRPLCGFISGFPRVDTINLVCAGCVLGGIGTVTVAFAEAFWSIGLYSAAFGVFMAIHSTGSQLLLIDLFGVAELGHAIGIIGVGSGLSSLIGPPLAGLLRDKTDSYVAPFHLAGASILLGALLYSSLLPCFRSKKSYSVHTSSSQIATVAANISSVRNQNPVYESSLI